MNSVTCLMNTSFISRPLQEKMEIKTLGRPTPDLPNLIQNVKTGSRTFKRKFSRDMYSKCNWLCGCETREALFCFPCLLFGGDHIWTNTGFKDLNHVTIRTKKHEATSVHMRNQLKLALLGCKTIAQKCGENEESILLHNEQVKKNRYALNIIINCVRFCGAFELALKGHDDFKDSSNPGILNGLINFSAELDSAMKKHLECATGFCGTSKTFQNELLNVMLEVCHEKISQEMKEANFLAVIVEETSDVSDVFQVAVAYRYIVKNRPVERFWSFVNPPQNGAAALASCILEHLELHKLDEMPDKLIAQTYNGASVMSGSSNQVQTIVKQNYPCAQLIHYHAHQFNLVIMRAASINRNVRIFFANVQAICSFFSSSVQRTSVLDDVVKKRLPDSAPTILWNFQSSSVVTVHKHRQDLIKCMESILKSENINDDCTLCQASGYLKVLSSGSFIFWLSFFSRIFPLIDILIGQLQKVKTPTVVEKYLSKFEYNISTIAIAQSNSVETYKVTTKEQSPNSKKRKIYRSEWKRETKEVCDLIIQQAKERFSSTEHFVADSLFAPDKFSTYNQLFPEHSLNTVCSAYKCLEIKKLRSELETIYSAIEFREISGAVALYSFLKENSLNESFSETIQLLEIIITIPMTTVEEERCFSTLDRVRTFLRNSMAQEQLSALAMLSIERHLLMEIPGFNQKVIEKFAHLKERQMDFLFK